MAMKGRLIILRRTTIQAHNQVVKQVSNCIKRFARHPVQISSDTTH